VEGILMLDPAGTYVPHWFELMLVRLLMVLMISADFISGLILLRLLTRGRW
jgi:hypothetical protein